MIETGDILMIYERGTMNSYLVCTDKQIHKNCVLFHDNCFTIKKLETKIMYQLLIIIVDVLNIHIL